MTLPAAMLFDLDGTLCLHERPASAVLATTFDRLDIDPRFDMGDFHDRYTEFLRECEDGRELYERCFRALAVDHGYEDAVGQQIAHTFLDERSLASVEPAPGTAKVLERFADQCRLGLVTNGHPVLQRRKLTTIGAADAFEAAVFAGYDTPAKPDPAPFDRVLSSLGVPPGDAVYVGNAPMTDVVGAHAAGLRAALVGDADGAAVDPDYQIAALPELLDIEW